MNITTNAYKTITAVLLLSLISVNTLAEIQCDIHDANCHSNTSNASFKYTLPNLIPTSEMKGGAYDPFSGKIVVNQRVTTGTPSNPLPTIRQPMYLVVPAQSQLPSYSNTPEINQSNPAE